jgi:GNAT superfamily N-acetyltransferase
MEKVSVRHARKSDEQFILVALGGVAQSSRQRVSDRNGLVQRLRKDCFGSRAKAKILIATLKGQNVGLMLYSPSYFALKGLSLWVSQLYVVKEMRGKGIAEKLWSALSKRNPQATYAHWAADKENKPAQKHFKRMGAEQGKYLYFYKKL